MIFSSFSVARRPRPLTGAETRPAGLPHPSLRQAPTRRYARPHGHLVPRERPSYGVAPATRAFRFPNRRTILDLWTADARVREPGMNLDRAGLETFMRDAFGAGLEVTALDVRSDDVFVHGDVAYQFGEDDETVRMPDADEPVTYENHFFARWERGEDGLWRLDRFVAGPREWGEM